jgi:hypothetical protein
MKKEIQLLTNISNIKKISQEGFLWIYFQVLYASCFKLEFSFTKSFEKKKVNPFLRKIWYCYYCFTDITIIVNTNSELKLFFAEKLSIYSTISISFR